MNARDRILARLRASALVQVLPEPDIAAHYAGEVVEVVDERPALIERFRRNIEAAHAEVISTTHSSWQDVLRQLCLTKGVNTLLAAPGLLAPDEGMPRLLSFDAPIDGRKDFLFEEVDAAVTRSAAAIAETGSLILIPDPEEPRTQSLVPPIHFVLLDATQIHVNLYSAMRAGEWASAMPTNLLLVSGPSKTADIQQTMAYGAHGPKELIVLLLEPEVQP